MLLALAACSPDQATPREPGWGTVAGDPGEATEQDPSVCGDAGAQLAWAIRCKLAMRELRGTELGRARMRAVAAYRAVRVRFPQAGSLAAEAAFRAGELLRSGGFSEEAAHEFRIATDLGRGTAFGARARLELGHLMRRSGRLWDALACYEELTCDVESGHRERDHASFWSACIRRDQGFFVEARRIWLRLARGAQDPLVRIRAYDSATASAALSGELAQACSHWRECRSRLAETAQEATELGARVRHALQNSRCVQVLRRSMGDRARAWPLVESARASTHEPGATR